MRHNKRVLLQGSTMAVVSRAKDDSASSPAESPPSPDAPSPSSDESSPPPPPADAPDSSPPPPPPASPPPPSGGSSDDSPAPASSNTTSPPPPASQSPPSPSSKALSPPPPPGTKSPPSSGSGSTPSSNSSSSSSDSSDGLSDQLKAVIGVSVAVGVVIIALVLLCVLCRKKKRKHHQTEYFGQKPSGYYSNQQHQSWQNMDPMGKMSPGTPGVMGSGPGWHAQPPPSSGEFSSNYGPALPPPSPSIALGFNKSTFTYDELAAATGGFAQENLLGQGGFGYVHKGLLPNGKEVAVKSLKSGSGQGEREFQAEVDIISRVHHRHLVSLVGYCMAGGQRMLVYEFVPNKTLEYHLHGKGLPVMDWPTRLKIAMGSAKGLAYIHEDCHPKIIHRDIKSANILLDFNFEAMVADFGLAKLSSDNYTHVSTRVMGTFGYLAPEYASSGKLTEKSDVFSFGVMLLEIITGKRPVDPSGSMEDSLVDWARPLLTRALEEGKYDELVDFRLENNYNTQEMQRMVACAAASIRHSARKRPKMSQIVRALEGDVSLDDLNEGIRPGQSSYFGGGNSSDYDTAAYNADMKKFRQMALTSTEFGSDHETSSSNSNEMQRP